MKLIYINRLDIRRLDKTKNISYLGYNFSNIKFFKDLEINIVDTRGLNTEVAHEIKCDFIDYIAEIGKNQINQVKWWATTIASKSNLQSDFFSYICLLKTFSLLEDKNRCSIVFVDDIRLFFLIKRNYKISTTIFSVIIASYIYIYKVIFMFMRGTFSRAKFIFLRLLYDNYSKNIFERHNGDCTYIYSWVEDRSFNSKGEYNDPYFPGINNFSPLNTYIIFLPYYVKKHLMKKFDKKALLDGLSSYSSFGKIIKSSLSFYKPIINTSFYNFDLRTLWFFEILTDVTTNKYVSNIHEYYCWLDFFKSPRKKILYPFENQPWEKMMILASEAVKSDTSIMGCLHTTTHRLLLSFHTTKKDVSYLPLPHVIIVNSKPVERLYIKYFKDKSTEIINGGSLRFSATNIQKIKNSADRQVIGVMLSCINSQTKEQLYDLNNNSNPQFDYLIKPHPDLPVYENYWQNNISYFSGTAEELYNIVDAIVYCSSTSGMEAYSYGIPVFRFLTQYLDLETGEDNFKPMLIKSIGDISEPQVMPHKPVQLFSPVNKKMWHNILN
tara:strand:- start:927 stop:2585 length:1659 start_codon:yes stop_codon:yes gene_type:complete